MRSEHGLVSRARSAVMAGSLAVAAAVICMAERPLAAMRLMGAGTGLGIGAGQLGAGSTGVQSGVPSGTHQTGGGSMPAAVGGSSPLGGAGSLDAGSSPFPDLSRQKRNDERQRRIVSDTQRLLTLTSQLKAEVAATGAETMSPEMLKQMEEIEKLAKSVKEKMKD